MLLSMGYDTMLLLVPNPLFFGAPGPHVLHEPAGGRQFIETTATDSQSQNSLFIINTWCILKIVGRVKDNPFWKLGFNKLKRSYPHNEYLPSCVYR